VSVVVFLGPSLDLVSARALLPHAAFLAPAQCGDVYRACRRGASVVALIDGYFDHRLSVWHKEILWALSQGTRVYGAASMGALRAAELDRYGMTGVGVVYEQFRSGELEDDDEVAVLHESRERNYALQSDALVNIRATLRAAVTQGVIGVEVESALITQARSQFYADRRLGALVTESDQLATAQKARLMAWLAERGVVDQKREDATRLLSALADRDSGVAPASGDRSSFAFAHTNYFRVLRENLDREGRGVPLHEGDAKLPEAPAQLPGQTSAARAERALEALRQESPERRADVYRAALERALGLMLAELAVDQATAAEVQAESDRFRVAERLLSPAQTEAWLVRNELSVQAFSALARDSVLARRFSERVRSLALQQVLDVLRLSGLFPACAGR